MNKVRTVLAILAASTLLLMASAALGGPIPVDTAGGTMKHARDYNKIQDTNNMLSEMNTMGDQQMGVHSIQSEMNEMITTTEEHAKREANTAAKIARETTKKMRTESHNVIHSVETTTRGKGGGATYKPSKHIAVAIPKKFAEDNTIKEMESKGMAKCKGDSCIIMMEKNTPEEHVVHILSAVLKRIPPKAKVHTALIRHGDYAVAKAVIEDVNKTEVSYATADQGIFAVTVEIPKSDVNSARLIEGNVIFLQTDPVLRIYLRSENNQIAVARFTIKKAVDLNTTDMIEFASCSIGVRNVRYNSNKGTISFQMSDGNQPVYIPSVKIVGPGTLVLPQYDSQTKTYTAKIKNTTGTKIEAYVDGCGEIIYPITGTQTNTGENKGGVAAILVVLGIIAAAILIVLRT